MCSICYLIRYIAETFPFPRIRNFICYSIFKWWQFCGQFYLFLICKLEPFIFHFSQQHRCRFIIRVLRDQLALDGQLQDHFPKLLDTIGCIGQQLKVVEEGLHFHYALPPRDFISSFFSLSRMSATSFISFLYSRNSSSGSPRLFSALRGFLMSRL